ARASEEKEKRLGTRSFILCIICCVQNIVWFYIFIKGTSVDTTWASVNTLSQNSPEGVLGRPLLSTLLGLVSTHCPSLARRHCVEPGTSVDTTWASVGTLSQNSPEGVLGRPLVSTLLGLVSTHCPSLARRCSGSCL
ncbi:hypothetical protein Taro_007573, partial [Colocasia esculenta]|nr:hypothetical protein [Colocasia esculenta]